MTATQQFIEDAVKGGWKYSCTPDGISPYGDGMTCTYSGCNNDWSVWTRDDNGSSICSSHTESLLRREVWRAVGKTRGWGFDDYVDPSDHYSQDEWEDKWHDFIAELADGKTIEQALEAIA